MATAKLSVVLKADETVVAESSDPILWAQLLTVIQGQAEFDARDVQRSSSPTKNAPERADKDLPDLGGRASHNPVERFARSLGLKSDIVEGALSPTLSAPYISLNDHNWEAFKKAVPPGGKQAVGAAALAGTMLALWIRDAKLQVSATQALTADVLDTIGQRDPNLNRGIKNAKWLQSRAGGSFIVNPAEISRAQEITRAFCLKRAPEYES